MIFIRHKWLDKAEVAVTALVAGRILGVQVSHPSTRLAIACVHSFSLSKSDLLRFKRWMHDATTTHPGAVLFAAVDWNFDESDDGVTTTTGRGDTTSNRARREQRRWTGPLRQLTSLTHGLPTRAARTTPASGTTPTILQSSPDRVYTSLPPTTLAFTNVTCRAAPISATLRQRDSAAPSDHVTVRTTLTVQAKPRIANRPVPSWVTRHPRYAADVQRRLGAMRFDALLIADAVRRCTRAKLLSRMPASEP